MTTSLHWLLPPTTRRTAPLRSVSPADGHDPGTLERWCREGDLVWVAGDVYLPVDVAGTPAARRQALALLAPAGAAVATAAAVWCRGGPGLPAATPATADDRRARVELLVPGGHVPRGLPQQVRTRQSGVPQDQLEQVGPVLVTCGPTTAVDLARWGEGPDDDAALAWLWEHGVTLRQATPVLRRHRRSPGVRRARRVLLAVRDGHPNPLSTIGFDDP